MPSRISSSLKALLILAALSASASFGQSLSIVKNAEGGYAIQASAPPNNPHALQTSGNLHLWVDILEEVQGQQSVPFTNAGVAQRYFRLRPVPTPAPPIRVMLIGDSMSSDCCGWGGGIHGYFKPNTTVVNYALPWTSTKVFLRSAEVDTMQLIKPDYVLIQYGYIDSGGGPPDPERETTLEEFRDNLRTIVQMIRGFNGVPILVTLHSPRIWDASGKVITTFYQNRNEVTRAVAAELAAPLIDLNLLSIDLLNELGESGSEFMQWAGGPPEDKMHVSPLGAQYVARLVANALPDSLGPYLTGIFDPPPKP